MTHEWYDDIPNAQVTPEMVYKYVHRNDNVDTNMSKKTGVKIIKDNFLNSLAKEKKVKPKTVHIICDNCDSELEVSQEDTYIGCFGTPHIVCPCCGEETMVDELEGIILTKDNIKFPVHFIRTNRNMRHVVEINEEEITKSIQRGIDYFRKNKDEYYWYTSCGDLFLFVVRYEGDKEYFIMVTKDFYKMYIPFEKEDYKK